MTTTTSKDRRGALIRAGIAAVAVLGIGGAITTAAWTDHVNFAGDMNALISIEGRNTPTTMDFAGDVVLPAVAPDSADWTAHKGIEIRNNSSVKVRLDLVELEANHPGIDIDWKGLFDHKELAANSTAYFDVRLAANEHLSPGDSGSVAFRVVATQLG